MAGDIQPISISSKACEQIRSIRANKGIPDEYGLRIGVRGGTGCGGATFIIGFDKRKDTDIAYEVDGIDVYVEKKHAIYLVGKKVDFVDEAEGRGFTFVEENANAG